MTETHREWSRVRPVGISAELLSPSCSREQRGSQTIHLNITVMCLVLQQFTWT